MGPWAPVSFVGQTGSGAQPMGRTNAPPVGPATQCSTQSPPHLPRCGVIHRTSSYFQGSLRPVAPRRTRAAAADRGISSCQTHTLEDAAHVCFECGYYTAIRRPLQAAATAWCHEAGTSPSKSTTISITQKNQKKTQNFY
jgi:hypothetical protein